MKLLKFSIFDSKAASHLPDWNTLNVAVAIRIFQEMLTTEGTPYNHHPGDYTLMEIGTFDQESGDIEKRPGGKFDHGNGLVHKSRAMLEQDYQSNHPDTPDELPGARAARERDDAKNSLTHLKYGKTITNGDALRAVQTKETTP